jgi:hypothetical protein
VEIVDLAVVAGKLLLAHGDDGIDAAGVQLQAFGVIHAADVKSLPDASHFIHDLPFL